MTFQVEILPIAEKQIEKAYNWYKEKMILAHTGSCTDILAEHYDSSKRALPQPGYRLKEYHRS